MEDITFKILKDNELVSVDSSEIFLNKRILICSIMEPPEQVSAQYLKHLVECQKKYKKHGIDNIYVTSFNPSNKWLIAYVTSFFPELTPIVDHEGKFKNYLKEIIDNNSNYLDNDLPYQVLINNGEIEHFYKSPEKDFVGHEIYLKLLKYIEKNIEKIVPIEIKKYKSEKQNMLFLGVNMLIYSLKNENKIYNYFDFQLIIARAFFYNSIWPNIKLEEYLQIKK